MKNFKDGSGKISSPNFPNSYPPNLDCQWEIGGEEGINVKLDISIVQLEQLHDTLKVYDGCCANRFGVVANLTGRYICHGIL